MPSSVQPANIFSPSRALKLLVRLTRLDTLRSSSALMPSTKPATGAAAEEVADATGEMLGGGEVVDEAGGGDWRALSSRAFASCSISCA